MGNVEAEATASRKEQVQKEEEDVASRGRLESLEEDQLEHVNSLRLVNKHLNTEVESLSAKLKAVEAERDGLQSLLSRLGEQLRVERLAHASALGDAAVVDLSAGWEELAAVRSAGQQAGWLLQPDEFEIQSKIGMGSSGTVYQKLKRLDSNASSTGDGEAVATLMASEDVADAGEMATQDDHVKIADFSLARYMPAHSEPLTGETGVIRHEPYSGAADVYSFAVLLCELLTMVVPYSDKFLTPIQVSGMVGARA
eukprot:gene12086-14281_t